jgi:AcrR family transcriptional regulator
MSSAPAWPSPPDPEQRLVERAFVAVVCERGLANTTVDAVSERAGVEAGAFRSRFADVEDVYRRLFEQGTQEVLVDGFRAFAGAGSYADRIRAVAHSMYRFMAEEEMRARFLYVEVFAAGERTQLIRDQGMEGMYELIDSGREELEDPESISRATAEAIGGSILQRIRSAISRRDLEGFRLSIPRLMYNVVLPYVGEERARAELRMAPPEPVGSDREVAA